MRVNTHVLMAAAVALGACTCDRGDDTVDGSVPSLRFAHTFNAHETGALNAILQRAGVGPVETSLLPFARGRTILGQVLREARGCPDLVRIDATWVPGLAADDLLAPAPAAVWRQRRWLDGADDLVAYRGERYGLPQSHDGLALIHRRGALEEARVPWPPATLGALEAAAHQLTREGRHGLGVRVDGYWFIGFLRASGGELLDPDRGTLAIDRPEAREALRRFARLFGEDGVAPPLAAPGDEARDAVSRFRAGRLAVVLDGPWALWHLAGGEVDELAVTPFPRGPGGAPAAPRGGQVYAVPRCAGRAAAAWQLALELTAPAVQVSWARRFGVVPTTEAGLAGAPQVVREFHRALEAARPLPRHPAAAELFDDLTPAIEAVVVGDASAEEALAGVARAWRRMLARHGVPGAARGDAGAGAGATTRDAGAGATAGDAGATAGDAAPAGGGGR